MYIYAIAQINWSSVGVAAGFFASLTLVLVAILIIARRFLVASGKVKINVNNGAKELEVEAGSSLLNTLGNARYTSLLGLRRQGELRPVPRAGRLRRR